MPVIAIAGLPGSGKSRLMDQLERQGYHRFNDINRNWGEALPRARALAWGNEPVAVSDIKFCDEAWRRRLEAEIGMPVSWIFFANDPWQCAKNCLYRFMVEKPYRPLAREIERIRALSTGYRPEGQTRQVFRIDEATVDRLLADAHLTTCQQR